MQLRYNIAIGSLRQKAFLLWGQGLLVCNLLSHSLVAQTDTSRTGNLKVQHYIEVKGIASGKARTPFWLWANQYGIVPVSSPAGLIRLGSTGRLSQTAGRGKAYLQYGLEVVGTQTRTTKAILPEGYIQAGFGKFYLYGGRKREVIGLGDSTLSSGFYSWSQNAMPMPKVQFGTQGFVTVPFTAGVLAVNALYAHGWFPNTDSMQHSFLHQKALYGRIGKPNWRVKLYGGMVHNAQWGGYSRFLNQNLSKNGKLASSLKAYQFIIIAKQPLLLDSDPFSKFDAINRAGNHVGSLDLAVEYRLANWTSIFYYQHPFEDKSGLALINMPDGLYGISLKRNHFSTQSKFRITQILIEHLNTLNQSGSVLNIGRRQYEGIDDYFNNYQYLDGWTSKEFVIGTPFISDRKTVRSELHNISGRKLRIINNRVTLLHFGVISRISSISEIQVKLSYSNNLGLYRVPFSRASSQLSGLIKFGTLFPYFGGVSLEALLAIDRGKLLYNNYGVMISIKKNFAGK